MKSVMIYYNKCHQKHKKAFQIEFNKYITVSSIYKTSNRVKILQIIKRLY